MRSLEAILEELHEARMAAYREDGAWKDGERECSCGKALAFNNKSGLCPPCKTKAERPRRQCGEHGCRRRVRAASSKCWQHRVPAAKRELDEST